MDCFGNISDFSALDTTSLIGLPTWIFIYLSNRLSGPQTWFPFRIILKGRSLENIHSGIYMPQMWISCMDDLNIISIK